MAGKEQGMGSSILSSLFGNASSSWMSGLYSSLSEYRSVTSGSYYKLAKRYYSQISSASSNAGSSRSVEGYDVLAHVSGHDVKKNDSKTDSADTSKASYTRTASTQKANTRTAAVAASTLSSSINSLMSSRTYDVTATNTADKVKQTVESDLTKFAADYNSYIDAAKKSTSQSLGTASKYLMNTTSKYSDDLKSIGLSVGKDGKLSVDTDTLKNADTDAVKKLFSGGNNYGSAAGTYISLAQYYASQALSDGTYTSSGSFAAATFSGYSAKA